MERRAHKASWMTVLLNVKAERLNEAVQAIGVMMREAAKITDLMGQ